jgi:hypothetical protein
LHFSASSLRENGLQGSPPHDIDSGVAFPVIRSSLIHNVLSEQPAMKSRFAVLLLPLFLLVSSVPSSGQQKYTTDVSAGLLFPTASFGTYFKTGLAVNLAFSMAGGEGLRYHLGLGYYRTALDNQGLNDDPDSNPNGGRYDVSGSVSAFPILIGVKFTSSSPGTKPYGVLEGGVYLYSKKFDGGTYTYPDGTPITVSSSSSFKVEPGLSLGAGVMFPLDDAKAIDVALRYQMIKNSQDADIPGDGYVNFSQFFTLTVGLSFGVGG